MPEGQQTVNDASAQEIDAAPIDAAAAPIDAAPAPIDAAPPDAQVLLSCDDQYGLAPGFQLCAQAADSCEFFLFSDTATPCREHCLNVGVGDCITAFDADPGPNACTRQEETGCMELTDASQICVCSRSFAL
jgi:hypothetical protein